MCLKLLTNSYDNKLNFVIKLSIKQKHFAGIAEI